MSHSLRKTVCLDLVDRLLLHPLSQPKDPPHRAASFFSFAKHSRLPSEILCVLIHSISQVMSLHTKQVPLPEHLATVLDMESQVSPNCFPLLHTQKG